MKNLLVMVLAALALGSEVWPPPTPPPPLAGFSFSPLISEYGERDPAADLEVLLDATQPDLVRLPVYWSMVQPTPDRLDFTSVDRLLQVVAYHNLRATHQTRVVLTVGARNFLYPELHSPAWAGPREQPYLGRVMAGHAYRTYFETSITRYRDSPLLYAWQVENEPLDYVTNEITGDDRISTDQLAWEVRTVHRLDPAHKAAITTYDGLNTTIDMLQIWAPALLTPFGPTGHPEAAMHAGDALGLDMYLDGPNIPYRHVTSISLRAQWKQQSIAFWADRAHGRDKDVWLAEMQAHPWSDSGTFTPDDMIASAVNYRQEELDVVLLWGVDTWLQDPAWLAAAGEAIDVLQA